MLRTYTYIPIYINVVSRDHRRRPGDTTHHAQPCAPRSAPRPRPAAPPPRSYAMPSAASAGCGMSPGWALACATSLSRTAASAASAASNLSRGMAR
eukprot:scaffold16219_cov102-Isochrysis_galbana.AAC.20